MQVDDVVRAAKDASHRNGRLGNVQHSRHREPIVDDPSSDGEPDILVAQYDGDDMAVRRRFGADLADPLIEGMPAGRNHFGFGQGIGGVGRPSAPVGLVFDNAGSMGGAPLDLEFRHGSYREKV